MNSVYLLLVLSLLCYILFFKATRDAWKKGREKVFAQPCSVPDIAAACTLQITGIILFGFLTAIVRMPEQMKFLSYPKDPDHYLMVVTAILVIIVFIASWSAALQKIKAPGKCSYPLNTRSRAAVSYFLFRVPFLVAYEFFFRGVLLFDVAMAAGITISIIANIALYVIIHLFDNRQTVIGAVPFGVVLCWLSWKTQSVWPAVFLHLVLALTYEIKMCCLLFLSPQKIIT